jgi:DNA-binding NtrC family response regulator
MNKVLVLGVDDSAMDRKLLRHAFKGHPAIDFIIVESPEKYFEKLTQDVKVVLIDHYVPTPIGFEIMEETIRKVPCIVPIICSNQSDMAVAVEAQHRGCYRYVIKIIKTGILWNFVAVEYTEEGIVEYDRRAEMMRKSKGLDNLAEKAKEQLKKINGQASDSLA